MSKLQRVKESRDALQKVFNELNQDNERQRKAADNLRASIQACDWAIDWLVDPETLRRVETNLGS